MIRTIMVFRNPIGLAIVALVVAACSTPKWDEIKLMPAPDVYANGIFDPLPDRDPMELIPYRGMLYATDRRPAGEDDNENYYVNDRGQLVRLGVARVNLPEEDTDWSQFRKYSLSKPRPTDFTLRVRRVKEYGILEDTLPGFAVREDYAEDILDGDDEFAAVVNAQLARSERKHVYIYVHGYKVVFENPMLVASELWHFLGYDGVMIAYAWPSTPSKWAYIRDTDTANGYARNMRKFLEFLAEKTDAEEVHIIAYSNGTRLVARAFEQLALINDNRPREEILARYRIANLVLVGSDLDRQVFAAYLADGVLNVARHMTIYVSEKDKALGFARRVTRRERLGQAVADGDLGSGTRRFLAEHKGHLSVIDVTDAEGSSTGNGHGYFRNSPWASSDILMMLMYGLSPEERGLQFKANMPVYEFPSNYIPRLWKGIAEVDPVFAEAYSARSGGTNGQQR